MTIEPKSTTGPHSSPDSLAADWLVQSGLPGEGTIPGVRQTVQNSIALRIPGGAALLTLASAAALRDALTEHLENMGSPTEALVKEDPRPAWLREMSAAPVVVHVDPRVDQAKAAEVIAHALRDSRGQRLTPPAPWPTVADLDPLAGADVPVEVRDAYAENSRTIGAVDVHLMTDEEASTVHAQLAESTVPGMLKDDQGILYTASAVRDLKVKAGRWNTRAGLDVTDAPVVPADAWDRTTTPVDASKSHPVQSIVVRDWTDAQCEGAWNHVQHAGKYGLVDRPSGRAYTTPAARTLRARLNKANGADAHRLTEDHNADPVCSCGWNPADHQTKIGGREDGRQLVRNHIANRG